MFVVAVDLGTSFIKCGIYDENGRCCSHCYKSVPDERPTAGVFIQRGEKLLAVVLKCIKSAVKALGERSKDVHAIVFTGQMAGFIGVDKEWNDITTWSCSLDSRYMPYTQTLIQNYGDLILKQSGTNCPVMAPKIRWFENEFENEASKIKKYLMISGYIIGKMGNLPIEEAVIDRSYLVWTGLADICKDSWSDILCYEIGLKKDLLPQIVQSNMICARLDKDIAEECGLKSGLPLVAGAGDKPAGCVGAAIVENGDAVIEESSYAGMSICVKEYNPDFKKRRLDFISSAIPNEYYVHHYIAGSGITLDWFADCFVKETQNKKEAFHILESETQRIQPGSEDLVAVGMPGGRALPYSGTLRGGWIGYNWSHTRGHFYRSLIESYSYEFFETLVQFEKLYPDYTINDIKLTGGGASSFEWNQTNADVLNHKTVTLNRNDFSLWGATIIALNAIGFCKDMKAKAKQNVAERQTFAPDIGRHKNYKKTIKKYNRAMQGMLKYFSKQ